MSTVAEILRKKGPVFNYVDADILVIHALASMKARNLSYLVVQKNNKYVGLVSERDYAHKIILMNKTSNTTTVQEIMSTDIPAIDSDTSVQDCMMMMNSLQTRYVAVFDDRRFRGVITIQDLMRHALYNKGEEKLQHEVLVY